MRLYEIAIRNLVRRKARALFLLAGLLVGISTVVALNAYTGAMTADINEKLEKFGANILILPRTESLSLTYGGITLGSLSLQPEDIRQADLSRLRHIENAANIAAIGPVVMGVVSAADRRILMAGIDVESVPILKPWWQIEGRLPDREQVLVGAEAARILNIAPGGVLRVESRDLPVAGVLAPTGSQDDQLIFTRLETAQFILGKAGFISLAEVAALCQACPVEEMVRQIGAALPNVRVRAIQQVVSGRMQTLRQVKTFSMGVSSVILLIGGLMVFLTLMGSVRERTREIGIFRAVGFRRNHIVRIILLEAGVISALAGVLGYGVGSLTAWFAVRQFSGGGITSLPLRPELAAAALILALSVGLASAIYPALRASRLNPSEALRTL